MTCGQVYCVKLKCIIIEVSSCIGHTLCPYVCLFTIMPLLTTERNGRKLVHYIKQSTFIAITEVFYSVKIYNQFRMTSTSAIVVTAVCAVVCIGYAGAYYSSPTPFPPSCEALYDEIYESGFYAVAAGPYMVSAYCTTEVLCGSTGWTRIGIADFSDPQIPCPYGFIESDDAGVRACRRQSYSTPNSVTLNAYVPYKEVCGKVHGIQFGSPDAFDPRYTGPKNSVDDTYLDGISITHGDEGSREHIFSLPAGAWEGLQCPCDTGSSQVAPAFVGTDYICESGDPDYGWHQLYYPNDPLWDGQQCGDGEAPCCTLPYGPYFYKNLGTYTTDAIELRVLTNQDLATDEDILLSYFEIYVK